MDTPPHKLTAAIFDLDGTLIDSGALVAASAIATFSHFGFKVPTAAEVVAYMGIPIEVYFAELAGPDFAKHNPADIYADYRLRFKTMVNDGHLKAFEGIPEILSGLKAAGIKTAVATSKETAPALHSCKATGILQYLDAITGSDEVKAYKPAPDTTLKCLEKLGLPAGPSVLVIGDAEADMGMGRAAGTKTCGVTWGAHDKHRLVKQSPDHIVSTRSELRTVLGLLT